MEPAASAPCTCYCGKYKKMTEEGEHTAPSSGDCANGCTARERHRLHRVTSPPCKPGLRGEAPLCLFLLLPSNPNRRKQGRTALPGLARRLLTPLPSPSGLPVQMHTRGAARRVHRLTHTLILTHAVTHTPSTSQSSHIHFPHKSCNLLQPAWLVPTVVQAAPAQVPIYEWMAWSPMGSEASPGRQMHHGFPAQ